MDVIISIAIVMGSLGMILGVSLAIAAKKYYIETDPRQDQIENLLPGVNCGACGFTGCDRYAEAITKNKDKIEINLCTPGGEKTTEAIGRIMGVKAGKRGKRIAVLMCSAKNVKDKFNYNGPRNCRSAYLTHGGQKNCEHGCLGFGDCAEICPTEAINMGENNLPHVIEERCIACGKCAEICPKNLYRILPISNYVHVRCKNLDKGGVARKKCDNPCIGCRKCEKVCQYDAIHVREDLASIDYGKCTSCGECVKVCPTKIIRDYKHKRPKGKVRKLEIN